MTATAADITPAAPVSIQRLREGRRRADETGAPHPMADRIKGYFGIGVERISKTGNLGNLVRSAHAFGAGFFFTVNAHYRLKGAHSDTSDTGSHVPFYRWDSVGEMRLPEGCDLVGVELMEGAVDLPSFHHPKRAAYVLGPELGSLSPEMQARCTSFIRIPTAFCLNVAMAGAIVMYDRVRMLGTFPPRPLTPRHMPEPISVKRGR